MYSQALLSDQNGMIYFNKQEYGRLPVDIDQKFVAAFGDTVAYLMAVFESKYVTIVKNSGAYSVDEERILKPVIYKKVKYLGKKYLATQPNSREKFKKILLTAIALSTKDTSQLEDKLKETKKVEEIEQFILAETSP